MSATEAKANTTTTTTEIEPENTNKQNPGQLYRVHGYSIKNERDAKEGENKKTKRYYFLHSLTFKKLTSPLAEFQEVMPVRLERRKFNSFDEMNRDANRIGAYQSKVENDITHHNDTKIVQFLNDKANMREITGKNPVSELFEVLGLNQFQHAAIKEKGEDTETRKKKGTLDQSYQIAASGTDSGYTAIQRIIDHESTGFCNRRAEGTNVWLSCCPLQPPERLKDFGQRLLYSSFVFREDKDAKLKHDAGELMVNAAIRHAALQEEKGGLAEAVRIKDLEIPVVPNPSTTTGTTEEEKEEEGEEAEQKEEEENPFAKYDDDSTTYKETMALLKKTTEQLDALEQTRKQNPVPYASEIQTASARDYYKEAALKDFNEMVDAKFKEVLTKRGKWS